MKKFLFAASLILLASCSTTQPRVEPWILGNNSAKVVVEVFSDLECPSCAQINPQLEELIKLNPDLAQLKFHHFPLSVHTNAFIAAEAAECAGDQSQFWEFVDLAYQNQSSLNEDYLYKMAEMLDLDAVDFETCLKERKYKEKIEKDMAEGTKRNITQTPAIYVNGEKKSWISSATFLKLLKKLNAQIN